MSAVSPDVLEAIRDLHAGDTLDEYDDDLGCRECSWVGRPYDYDEPSRFIEWPCDTARLVYDDEEIEAVRKVAEARDARKREAHLNRVAAKQALRSLGVPEREDPLVAAYFRQLEFALTSAPIFRSR